MSNSIKEAIDAFSNGLPVCLFDSEKREGETDLLFSAQHVTPANKEKATTLKSAKKSTTKTYTTKQSKKILKSNVKEEKQIHRDKLNSNR